MVLARSITSVVRQLGIVVPVLELHVDNQATVSLGSDGAGSWRTRHLKGRASYLREQVGRGELRVLHCRGEVQKADLLTKCLPRQRHSDLCELWQLGRQSSEGIKAKILRIILLCGWICGSKGEDLEVPLQLGGSFEFYVIMAMVGALLLVIWELIRWGCKKASQWWKRHHDPRRLRRLERLRNMVEEELAEQLQDHVQDKAPIVMKDQEVQCNMGMTRLVNSAPTRVEISEVVKEIRVPEVREIVKEIPVPPTGPYFTTTNGEHVHIHRDCWGLRKASQVSQRTMCSCCLNGGRQLYPARTM